MLTAPSPAGGAGSVADLCLSRMKDSANPMPPAGLLAASEVAAFEKWIVDGMPQGTCATAVDLPVCTSGQTDTSFQESPSMQPGKACIACHASDGEAPLFTLAGTVYPTFHEPDQCVSQVVSAQVIVTDAAGQKVTMNVSPSSGNFSSFQPEQFPVTVEVVDSAGRKRPTASGASSGDCNLCHAPGPRANAVSRLKGGPSASASAQAKAWGKWGRAAWGSSHRDSRPTDR
ncbi:MAG TPA: hypothetical protein VGK67_41740 [Myxococcales bacterium]|jgi:hypothetical protein